MRYPVLSLLLLALLAPPLAAGSAGITNGAIQGVVYDDQGRPLGGVNVVAVRQVAPQVIRSATTDEMGNYFMGDMYLGEYVLGFSKFGFKTIDTSGAGLGSPTVTGSNVLAVVESGMTSVAPSVNLVAEPDQAAGNVTITVADLTTAQPVSAAAVAVGAFPARPTGQPGVFKASVTPVYVNGVPAAQPVQILADGFAAFSGQLTVFAHQQLNTTFRLSPNGALLNGRLRAQPPGSDLDLTKVTIDVDNLSSGFTQGAVTANGEFSLTVPVSTASIQRLFTIRFNLLGFKTAVLDNVHAPTGGTATLPEVTLVSQMVAVMGQVLLSNGQPAQSGTVLIKELGQQVSINGGQFSVQMPVARSLTLVVTANDGNGRLQRAQVPVKPDTDGSDNPVFNIGPVVTSPLSSSNSNSSGQ